VVISPVKEFTRTVCGAAGGLLIMEEPGPVCMGCADMDHLVFLPAGDAAPTRRARAASRLSAVVVRFSRSRRRYVRQGILVEEDSLERAEAECLADEDARARRRERTFSDGPRRISTCRSDGEGDCNSEIIGCQLGEFELSIGGRSARQPRRRIFAGDRGACEKGRAAAPRP